MTYHIALCDDDAVQREYLADLVSAWAAEAGLDVRLALFPSGEAFLARDLGQFSILLLDIEMPGMDGITLARGVRERNETAVIVFITGYAEYIAEGYDVSALHYLMKPVDKSKLFSVLEKAVKTLDKNGKLLPLERMTLTLVLLNMPMRFQCDHACTDGAGLTAWDEQKTVWAEDAGGEQQGTYRPFEGLADLLENREENPQ